MNAAAGLVLAACAALTAAAGAALASPASVERGSHIAQANCTPCHAIVGQRPSPVPGAPRFADLKTAFPQRTLDEIVVDALTSRHPVMPAFAAAPDDVGDLIDYLQTIQSRKPPTAP